LGRSPLKRQQEGFTLIVKMLSRHQGFSRLQRRTESLIARLTRMGLNPSPSSARVTVQPPAAPATAGIPAAVRHPIVGVRAEAVVNMHRPQLNGRILFAPADQRCKSTLESRPPLKATKNWRCGVAFAQYLGSSS
jgi:hypothetical protein